MISAEKVINIEVVELIKIYNFYFDHLFIQQSATIHCSQNLYLSYSYINYKRDAKFVNNVTITLSNEEITKIKGVDIDRFYSFMFMSFSIEIIYCFKMLFEVAIFGNLNFELIKQSHMKRWLK
jgi:hypothetical protein